MHDRDGPDAVPALPEILLAGRVLDIGGLKVENAQDDLKIVVHPVIGLLQEDPLLPQGGLNPCLRDFNVGDIPCDVEDVRGIIQGHDLCGHQPVPYGPVLHPEKGLEVVDLSHFPECSRQVLPVPGVDPDFKVQGCFPDDLFPAVAGDFQEAFVDVMVKAVLQPVNVDGIGADHEGHPELFLALAEGFMGPDLIRDVKAHAQPGSPALVIDLMGVDIQRNDVPVLFPLPERPGFSRGNGRNEWL